MTNKSHPPVQGSFTLYHGSGCAIDRFNYAFTGVGNDEVGSGFYFTTSLAQALDYTERRIDPNQEKPGGMDSPTVHVAQVNFQGLVDHDYRRSLKTSEVLAILRASPRLEEVLGNFGDLDDEPRDRVLFRAAKAYVPSSEATALRHALFMMANDFFRHETQAFNEVVKKVLGIDGMVVRHEDNDHYVVFTPEQITITERLAPAEVQIRINKEIEQEVRARSRASRPIA